MFLTVSIRPPPGAYKAFYIPGCDKIETMAYALYVPYGREQGPLVAVKPTRPVVS